jgi:hypothetical protein
MHPLPFSNHGRDKTINPSTMCGDAQQYMPQPFCERAVALPSEQDNGKQIHTALQRDGHRLETATLEAIALDPMRAGSSKNHEL